MRFNQNIQVSTNGNKSRNRGIQGGHYYSH